MEKKNKVIAALAVGALALLVASGAARCSMQQGAEEREDAQEASAAAQQAEAGDAASSFAEYENTHWTSPDGKRTLDILPGAMVERGPDGDAFWYYELDEVKSDGDGLAAEISLSAEKGGEPTKGAISIVRANGACTLACDGLKSSYAMGGADASELEIVGFEADHAEFAGRTESEFAAAVAKAAAARSPYAKSATWSKEVWIDYSTGKAVTNFTLDDKARSVVSVTVDASGKLVAS